MFCRLSIMFALFTVGIAPSPSLGGGVSIALRGVVSTNQEVVTIADVARLSGGDLVTRRKIAQLDLVHQDGPQDKIGVTKQQVRLRIIIAGVPPRQFTLSGPETVLIRRNRGHDPSGDHVLRLLQPVVANRLRVEPTEIRLKLARPLSRELHRLIVSGARVEPLFPDAMRTGPMTVKVRAYTGQRLVRTDAVFVEILVAQSVYVAVRRLDAGTTILADDVQQERQFVSSQGQRSAPTSVVGKTLRRSVPRGGIIATQDLHRPTAARPEIVIRTRDVVDVIARANQLQVKISGAVALQQGAVGDAIRVRNPTTKKVFTAKVVNAGIVEIRL